MNLTTTFVRLMVYVPPAVNLLFMLRLVVPDTVVYPLWLVVMQWAALAASVAALLTGVYSFSRRRSTFPVT